MSDRTTSSREQRPPSSSTADRRRPHVRFPGVSQQQDAHFSPDTPSNSHDIQRSPSWSAPKAMDSGLHPESRPHRKRVRAEDLWDRDEEDLLRQRRAKELASSDLSAGAGEESQHDFMGPSELPQNLHSFGGVVDGLIHGDPAKDRGQAYTWLEGEALNYAEGDALSGSLESQSSQQAYTRQEADAADYTEANTTSRAPESQGFLHLKRPRDRYLDDSNIKNDPESPPKHGWNGAGNTGPSIVENGSHHNTSQDALIDVLLKKLADEQGKNKAAKQELKRLKFFKGVADKRLGHHNRTKGKKNAVPVKRENNRAGKPCQSTLSAESSAPATKRPDGISRLVTFTKFGSLPEDVQDIILGMLLESPGSIKLDTSRLVTFVKSKVGLPYTISSGKGKKKRPKCVLKPAYEMRAELDKIKADLDAIPHVEWPSEPVVTGLTLSVLSVSKAIHKRAARSFYGNNVFEFSNAHDAWQHLELFLTTIGPRNANNLQHLCVAMPKWFPDASRDKRDSALLDALSPITRLATLTNAAKDPLLSAISSCTANLVAHGGLESFKISTRLSDVQSFLNFRHYNPAANPAAERSSKVKRENDGIRALWALLGELRPRCKTELVILSKKDNEKGGTESCLPSIRLEAGDHGLEDDRVLRVSGKLEVDEDV